MTKEEKIQWLRGYRTAALEVERLRGEIERWRSLAEKVTPTLSALPASTSADGTRTETAVEQIEERCAALELALCVMAARCEATEKAIQSVPDERLRLLLRYRYIDGMAFERIAEKLRLSRQWVCGLHDSAVNQIGISAT